MRYALLFLEGIVTFISPCLLPMLPIYILYFAGENGEKTNVLKNAVGFVVGFSAVFIVLGAFAGSIGGLFSQHDKWVNMITGAVVILFGLNFLGVLHISFLNKQSIMKYNVRKPGFFSSVLFGVVFSAAWTPCVGAFLGAALMKASQRGSAAEGMLMLLFFSLGLGLPFIVSALLIEQLKGAFDFIKKHYKVINIFSGGFLIIIGILMMTGLFGSFLWRLM